MTDLLRREGPALPRQIGDVATLAEVTVVGLVTRGRAMGNVVIVFRMLTRIDGFLALP